MTESIKIFLGYEVGTGASVSIPIFHTLVTGQTRLSGKTTLLKALSKRVVKEGFQILVLDSKSNFEDYATFGEKVPVCLRKTTDSLPLLELLESIFDRKISRYYPTLTNLVKDTENYSDIINNGEKMKIDADSFIKGACDTIIDLLKRLEEQTLKIESTEELDLPYDINRMSINQFELAGQHLIANSVFTQALKNHPKLIIILDEANKFLPQRRKSACTDAVTMYVTQGGATENYLWLGTQFLATTSKDAMKAMPLKLLGRQDHTTEIGHARDLIPEDTKVLDKFDMMKLNLGHFIFVDTDSKVRTIYAVPEFANLEDCKRVAFGQLDPRNIRYSFDFPKEEVQSIIKELEIAPNSKSEPESEIEVFIEKDTSLDTSLESTNKSIEETINPDELNQIKNNFENLQTKIDNLQIQINQLENTPNEFPELKKTVENVQIQMNQLEDDVTRVMTLKTFITQIKNEEIFSNTVEGALYFLGMIGFLTEWHTITEIMHKFTELQLHPTTTKELKTEFEKLAKFNRLLIEVRPADHMTYYKFGPSIRFPKRTERTERTEKTEKDGTTEKSENKSEEEEKKVSDEKKEEKVDE